MRLFAELLPDQERVLGRDHADTLTTRNNIACWTGEAGDAREALRLFSELLPDLERVLGRDHPDTLTTRSNIACWTGETGDAARRCGCSPSCCRTGSGCWAATTPTRSRPAATSRGWTGEVGDARQALRLFTELLPDQERVLGRDHPDTLTTRSNIARWTGEVGDAREALRLFAELLPDQERVLGRDHPDTLTTRSNIASWTGEVGTRGRRCGCSPSCCRIRSGCWAATTPTRSRPAATSRLDRPWGTRVRRCGCPAVLPDMERVLGRDHPDTLGTSGHQAAEIGRVPIRGRKGESAIWLTDPAVDVLVEVPPDDRSMGSMRRRSVMGGRRGPVRLGLYMHLNFSRVLGWISLRGRSGACDSSCMRDDATEWETVNSRRLR